MSKKEELDSRKTPLVFTPDQCLKYEVFLRWAKSCGHYSMKTFSANFDKFVDDVAGIDNGSA